MHHTEAEDGLLKELAIDHPKGDSIVATSLNPEFESTMNICLKTSIALLCLLTSSSRAVAQTEAQNEMEPAVSQVSCPEPALSRFIRHTVASGETLETIARKYGLMPTTLIGLNPDLTTPLQAGQILTVPPYNGRVVQPEAGQTWQDAAIAYNSRADVLFELNGCQANLPERIFVPGVEWQPITSATVGLAQQHPLGGYPLAEPAEVLSAYGWQPDPEQAQLRFNTGVTLQTAPGTSVLAAGEGTVAYVGSGAMAGNFVVVNHQQGLQTRYANLADLEVSVGEHIGEGAPLGKIALTDEPESSFLYFEIRLNSELGWVAQDPQQYIPALGVR